MSGKVKNLLTIAGLLTILSSSVFLLHQFKIIRFAWREIDMGWCQKGDFYYGLEIFDKVIYIYSIIPDDNYGQISPCV